MATIQALFLWLVELEEGGFLLIECLRSEIRPESFRQFVILSEPKVVILLLFRLLLFDEKVSKTNLWVYVEFSAHTPLYVSYPIWINLVQGMKNILQGWKGIKLSIHPVKCFRRTATCAFPLRRVLIETPNSFSMAATLTAFSSAQSNDSMAAPIPCKGFGLTCQVPVILPTQFFLQLERFPHFLASNIHSPLHQSALLRRVFHIPATALIISSP